MHRLVQKLVVLSVLLGALIFLASPRIVRADFDSCDVDLFSRIDYCAAEYQFCLVTAPCMNASSPSQCCRPAYNACLGTTQGLYNDCLAETYPAPAQLPIKDESRAQCYETCQEACDNVPNPGEKLLCLSSCHDFCDETYPKP